MVAWLISLQCSVEIKVGHQPRRQFLIRPGSFCIIAVMLEEIASAALTENDRFEYREKAERLTNLAEDHLNITTVAM